MQVRVVKSRATIWTAEFNGEEMAHAEVLAGEAIWYLDADAPEGFELALLDEIDRLIKYDYRSSAALDRDLKAGRVRALNN